MSNRGGYAKPGEAADIVRIWGRTIMWVYFALLMLRRCFDPSHWEGVCGIFSSVEQPGNYSYLVQFRYVGDRQKDRYSVSAGLDRSYATLKPPGARMYLSLKPSGARMRGAIFRLNAARRRIAFWVPAQELM